MSAELSAASIRSGDEVSQRRRNVVSAAAVLVFALAGVATSGLPAQGLTPKTKAVVAGAVPVPAGTAHDVPLPEAYAAFTLIKYNITATAITPSTTTVVLHLPDGAWQGHGIDTVTYWLTGTSPTATAPIDTATESVTVTIPAGTPAATDNKTATPHVDFLIKGVSARSSAPAPPGEVISNTPYSIIVSGTIAYSSTAGGSEADVSLATSAADPSNVINASSYWVPDTIPLAPGDSIHFGGTPGLFAGMTWGGGLATPTSSMNAHDTGLSETEVGASELDATLPADADFSPYFWPTPTPAVFEVSGGSETSPAPMDTLRIEGAVDLQKPNPLLPNVSRVAGTDRFATAIALSQSAFPTTAPTVYVVDGYGFADALSAGPAAALAGGPLLLTGPNWLPDSVGAEISRLRPAQVVIVGGPAVVSAGVEQAIRRLGPNVTRIAGADRYDTSRKLLAYAFPNGAGILYAATGRDFPDALSASAAAGAYHGALLLVDGLATALDSPTEAALTPYANASVSIVGGPAVVSSGLQNSMATVLHNVNRIAGSDRFETSLLVAKSAFLGPSDQAYIATGLQFPDALAASAVAANAGAPLLLAEPGCVPVAARDLIHSLATRYVAVVGGPNALGDELLTLTTC